MKKLRYVCWQDGEMFLGYLEDLPDYLTQGQSLDELEENLRDILADVAANLIPQARRVRELTIA